MKRVWFLSVLIVLAAAGVIAFTANQKYLTCQVFYRHDADVQVDSKTIKTEVVRSVTERQKGLSGRDCIGPNQGMLFVLDKEGRYPFWMKDMKFPIDIIWVDVNHHVVKVEAGVQPSTYPRTFSNDRPAQYVLELKGGQAAKLGINNNTVVQF